MDFSFLLNDSGNSTGSVSNTVFLYPNVTAMDSVDSGEILCNSLRILSTLRELDLEQQRFTGVRRKDKTVEDKVEMFEFTKDTFNTVNSEAAIQALYLLFNCLNAKEAEQRFRDCWPVCGGYGGGKMEGIFRKVAADWMQEIIESDPTFFEGIRSDAIRGLLVISCGERFIAMMRRFCQFVMYKTAVGNKDVIKHQVLLPPVPTQDSEITNRQLQVLTCRTQKVHENIVQKYKFILRTELAVDDRIKRVDDAMDDLAQKDEVLAKELRSYIYSYPDIFGNPTDAELNGRDEIIKAMKINQLIDSSTYEDFIRDRLETLLKKQADDIYKPVTLLHNIVEDYDKIWYILEMEEPWKNAKPGVLNWNEIIPQQIKSESDTPTLDMLLSSIWATLEKVLSDKALNEPLPPEVMNDFKAYNLRLSYLEGLESQVKQETAHIPSFSPIINFRDNSKMRLEKYDFSLLSKVHDMRGLLDVTPVRVFDINKSTGRTPSINNFLDSSSSSSSGLGERTTIVKRKSANITLPRPPGRIHAIETKDGPDLALTPSENLSTANSSQLKNFKSDPFVLTPVLGQSNTQNISFKRISASASLKKSVSFDSTTSSEIPPETPDLSANARSSISSSNTSSTKTTVNQSNVSVLSENLETVYVGVADVSIISDIESPVEINVATQERISKLLESIAHNSSSSSFSKPGNSDIGNETCISRGKRDNSGISLNELSTTEPDSVAGFGNISVIEDWEDTRGIMEMSLIEMNSDSDE